MCNANNQDIYFIYYKQKEELLWEFSPNFLALSATQAKTYSVLCYVYL